MQTFYAVRQASHSRDHDNSFKDLRTLSDGTPLRNANVLRGSAGASHSRDHDNSFKDLRTLSDGTPLRNANVLRGSAGASHSRDHDNSGAATHDLFH